MPLKDNDFINEYKNVFDKVSASDELREKVLAAKPQKRRISPYKAALGTVAAAFMIFAALHDYTFNETPDGVISETTVETQMPESEFLPVEVDDNGGGIDTDISIKTEAVGGSEIKTKSTDKPSAKQPDTSVENHQASENTISVEVSDRSEAVKASAPQIDESMAVYSVSARLADEDSDTSGVSYVMWDINEYYNYIGTDIGSCIGAVYTGPEKLEFDMGENGVPIDDTAVLTYKHGNGYIRITVSKHGLFDGSLNGSISAAGSGFNAYKIKNGVHYLMYTQNMTQGETETIIGSL